MHINKMCFAIYYDSPIYFVASATIITVSYVSTPWSSVILDKTSGLQLVKKFPAFYGTRKFITAFTFARHLSLSWARSIQAVPPHPTSWRSTLILSSHLLLGLQSGLFPSGFPTINPVYTSLLLHTCCMFRPYHPRFDHPNDIWWGVEIIKLLSMQFSPLPCFLVSLRLKYSPQHSQGVCHKKNTNNYTNNCTKCIIKAKPCYR
jgi:hypothetical protein